MVLPLFHVRVRISLTKQTERAKKVYKETKKQAKKKYIKGGIVQRATEIKRQKLKKKKNGIETMRQRYKDTKNHEQNRGQRD